MNRATTLTTAMLRTARTRIDRGQERYICFAVGLTVDQSDHLHSPYEEWRPVLANLLTYISSNVHTRGCQALATLDIWLLTHFGTIPDDDVLQQCRLAWIDRMIESLETKGQLP